MKPPLEPDFTEARYRSMLAQTRSRFRFVRFEDDLRADGIALWRHDIDFSPQRALALARAEAEQSVTACYFVLLGSPFYNPFEPAIRDVLRATADLGHDLGLHYDAATLDGMTHSEKIATDAATLSSWLQRPIRMFSLHNPSVSPDATLEMQHCAGLLNVSAPHLREAFTYVSDSNGSWRHRSLHEAIHDPSVTRLYALTHPEWWTPEPMTPLARVTRAIQGRAERVEADYRAFLARYRPEALENE